MLSLFFTDLCKYICFVFCFSLCSFFYNGLEKKKFTKIKGQGDYTTEKYPETSEIFFS